MTRESASLLLHSFWGTVKNCYKCCECKSIYPSSGRYTTTKSQHSTHDACKLCCYSIFPAQIPDSRLVHSNVLYYWKKAWPLVRVISNLWLVWWWWHTHMNCQSNCVYRYMLKQATVSVWLVWLMVLLQTNRQHSQIVLFKPICAANLTVRIELNKPLTSIYTIMYQWQLSQGRVEGTRHTCHKVKG